jgi:hypothetical protein
MCPSPQSKTPGATGRFVCDSGDYFALAVVAVPRAFRNVTAWFSS